MIWYAHVVHVCWFIGDIAHGARYFDIKLLTLLGCNRHVNCCSLELKTDIFCYFTFFHCPSKQIPDSYTNLAAIYFFHALSNSFFNIFQICYASRELLMPTFHKTYRFTKAKLRFDYKALKQFETGEREIGSTF